MIDLHIKFNWFFWAFLLALGLALPQIGAADQSKPAETQEAEEEKASHELQASTVTAQKRNENTQEVPAAITALSEIQLQDADIHNTNEIAPYVPNFTTTSFGYGYSNYSIRGMNNSTWLSPAVGIYIDDVPAIGSANVTDSVLYDLERVEVLRGAQGNLYGMNTSGGVVNIITRQPGETMHGKATVAYQEYDATRVNASIDGALIKDKLYLSLAGFYSIQNKSFFDNTLNQTEPQKPQKASGRFKLLYKPLSTLNIEYTYAPNRHKGKTLLWSPIDGDPFTFLRKDASTEKSETDLDTHSLRVKYETPYFDIVSVTAYTQLDFNNSFEAGPFGTGLFIKKFEENYDAFTQEIRLVSAENGSPLKWLIGGFFSQKDDETKKRFLMDAAYRMKVDPGKMISDNRTKADLESTTWSIYGQASYPLIDKLTLTLGLRYDVDDKKTNYLRTNPMEFSAKGPVRYSYTDSETWNALSPKAVLDYQWTPEILSYLSVAKSYKSGGYSTTSVDTAETAKFDPEYAWTYEVGLKTSWFNNRLLANLAAFVTKSEDLQICTYDEGTYLYRNAGKSTMKGIELEVMSRPLPGLNIMASLGLLDATFDEFEKESYSGKRSDLSGNYVPNAPKYTANLMAQYRFKWGGYIRGQGYWTGDTYFDEANNDEQAAYFIANGKIGYEMKDVDIYLFANNIFDKRYYNYSYPLGLPSGLKMGMVGEPRIVGLMATVHF